MRVCIKYLLSVSALLLLSTYSFADSRIIKQNEFGKLIERNQSLVFYYKVGNSQHQFNVVSTNDTDTELRFSDSSYLKINGRTASITRYSELTKTTETFSIDSTNIGEWHVRDFITQGLNLYKAFDATPPSSPPDLCQEPEHFCPEQLPDYKYFYSQDSNNCAHEQNEFTNRAWNGHRTLDNCMATSQRATAVAGVSTLVFCFAEPSKLGCGASVFAYLNAIDNQSEVEFQCQRGYEQTRRNLDQCIADSGDGDGSGGDVGGGAGIPIQFPGTDEPAWTLPRYCYYTIKYQICVNGNDCRLVTQYEFTQC